MMVYGILDLGYVSVSGAVAAARGLLEGGVSHLQVRAKGHDLGVIRGVALDVLPLCRAAGVPLVINDHVALAAEIGADGLHLGQDDGPLAEARSVVGNSMVVGRSTHSLAQARAALAEGFDYIGFGPLYPTPTKAGRPAIGLADIAVMEREVGVKIPAFCIGGIHFGNLAEVRAAGARRVVMVSALLQAGDIAAAVGRAKEALA